MDKAKRERLEANGWNVGTVADFLKLTPAEEALIEIKFALSRLLRQRRQERMTQSELAELIHSSQPRIAKAEGGDSSVSIELLVRAMLATGVTPNDIGQAIASVGARLESHGTHGEQFPPRRSRRGER